MLRPPDTMKDDWIDADACTLSRALDERRIGAEALMQCFLERIDAVNDRLNAIVSRRPADQLLAEAAARDRAWAAGKPRRGWLDGLPMAIKDLSTTAGLTTTFGSPLFADHVPHADNLMVSRLRAAGAIFIGKTNTPEFGLGSQTYNRVFGATGSAYDSRLTAGGSSGGAAAALAARMVPIADGSDMMGSLRNPAAYNNVFGLRPSPGRVPALPVPDVFSPSLGTEGPMARSAADLAALLATQAGPDARAPLSIREDPAGLAAPLSGDIEGRRIAWLGDWDGYYPLEAGVLEVGERALARLSEAGCEIQPCTPRFDPDRLWQAWCVLRQILVAGKFEMLYRDPEKRAALKPEAVWEIDAGLGRTAIEGHHAQVTRSAWFAELNRLFDEYDAIALPSAQVFAFDRNRCWPDRIAGRAMDTYHRWMEIVIPGSLSAGPTLALPAGFDDRGRSMGIQLLGCQRGERGLLEIAAGYEGVAADVLGRRPAL
ncbi:amidase [Salinisphaera hydrothermalis C41B8]|uniref:Amidase n=2 Tax=Salinisphaera TaxID=180541 RepID=A0A084ILA5_SALHC|nr:amidase [Salinisphaera hydrothermalis C41B8]